MYLMELCDLREPISASVNDHLGQNYIFKGEMQPIPTLPESAEF